MTIEFANWRISQNFLVFTKLEESSFYSITCFHQLVTNLLELWRCFFLHQPFVDRNSPWGFENLDPPKNLHKSLSNPPKKKWSRSLFWGQEFTTTARCLVWFRGISAENQWGSPPIRHCQTWTCTICLTHQWATCSHPALWWLIAWNCGVQYEQICDFHLVGGRHPNSRPMGAKKVAKLSSVWGANMICYQHPCLGWRPVLIGNKNSPYSCQNSQYCRTYVLGIFPSTGLCLVAVDCHHSLKSECSLNAAKNQKDTYILIFKKPNSQTCQILPVPVASCARYTE